MDDSMRMIKEPVLGILVVRHKRTDGKDFVSAWPIVSNDETFADVDVDLEEGDKVLGVLPAPSGTFKVLGLYPDEGHEEDLENGTFKEIGFEFEEANNPDWIMKLNDDLKAHKQLLIRRSIVKDKENKK